MKVVKTKEQQFKENVAIIGAGAWGTTLACIIAEKGINVNIWAYKKETCDDINILRENREFLAKIAIPHNVQATNSLKDAIENSKFIIIASPSHTVRQILKSIKPYINSNNYFISVVKGIEEKTFKCISEIIIEEFGEIYGFEKIKSKVAVVSGPNLAREVAIGLPSSTVVASLSKKLREEIQVLLSNIRFRVYTSEDIIGCEIGGALKNVMAIGAGICDGLGYGDNTKAAFLTRALREIILIGEKKGALKDTFYGLSGIGDLFATSFSKFSRNRMYGEKIALGMKKSQIETSISGIAEGVYTVKSAYIFGYENHLDLPVVNEIYKIIYENKNPQESVKALMSRTLKDEHE